VGTRQRAAREEAQQKREAHAAALARTEAEAAEAAIALKAHAARRADKHGTLEGDGPLWATLRAGHGVLGLTWRLRVCFHVRRRRVGGAA